MTVLGAVARVLEIPLVISGERLRRLDAIVVLGSPLRDGALTPPLRERVAAAVELWQAGGAPLVVASGGVTHGAARSEASAMAELLRERGVSEIVVEDASRTTAENASCTAALLAARGVTSVWIVTQPFHGRRATWLFRAAGLDAHAWHISNSLEYTDRRRALRWIVREYAAWGQALLTKLAARSSRIHV